MTFGKSCRGLMMLLMALPACAQFADLAATDDGKKLYFTSPMLFHNEQSDRLPAETRLYRFEADGVTLIAERGALAPESGFSSNDGVAKVSVTGDGSLVAFTLNGVCLSQPCVRLIREAQVRGKQSIDLGPGYSQISRNGHWALLRNTIYDDSNPFAAAVLVTTLVDLTTGARTIVSQVSGVNEPSDWGNALASDGTVLTFKVDGAGTYTITPLLWKQGQLSSIPFPTGVSIHALAITDDASTILGYLNDSSVFGATLASMNLATGRVRVIGRSKDANGFLQLLSASQDGQRVLYQTVAGYGPVSNAYIWDAGSDTTIPVPLDPGEFAVAGTLTGPGDFAFVSTSRARILKLAVQAGANATPIFPATPYCDSPGDVARGSLVRFHCTFNLSPAELSDKLSFVGWPVPILASHSGDIDAQLPWERDVFDPSILTMDIPSPSGFQPSQELRVFDGAPSIFQVDPGQISLFGIKIVKGDWSGLVTSSPLPGDIVHIYMTGLGPVSGDVTTGLPAPLNSLRPIEWDLSCRFLPQPVAARLLFAGLAPGMLGVYQVTLQIPADAGTAPVTDLKCNLANSLMAETFGPGTPTYGMFGYGAISSLVR